MRSDVCTSRHVFVPVSESDLISQFVENERVVEEFSARRLKALINDFVQVGRMNALLSRAYETIDLLENTASDTTVPVSTARTLLWRYTVDFFALTPETLETGEQETTDPSSHKIVAGAPSSVRFADLSSSTLHSP